MKTKFTPGPWLHRVKSDSVHMPPPEPPYIYGESIFAFSEYRTPSDENLALILAAPELYAACEAVEHYLNLVNSGARKGLVEANNHAEELALSALAKARGES